jgi:hypothetical protein
MPTGATDNSRCRRDIGKRAHSSNVAGSPAQNAIRRRQDPLAGSPPRRSRLRGGLSVTVGCNFGCLAEQCGVLRAEEFSAEPHRRLDLRLPKRSVRRLAAAQTLDQEMRSGIEILLQLGMARNVTSLTASSLA